MSYEAELDFAKELALEAGQIMRRYFRAEDIGTEWKADETPLTVADTAINKLVIKKVKATFPQDGILGEEESFHPDDRARTWVVDPIDGTIPFSLDVPTSMFSLALVERHDGQPVVAALYDPQLDHLYTAIKGQGSYLNGIRIHTSKSNSFKRNTAAFAGHPTKTDTIDYVPGRVADIVRKEGTKHLNVLSHVYASSRVASGQLCAALIGFGSPWDSAGAALLVTEAGGKVTDLEGKKRRFDEFGLGCMLAANPAIHKKILATFTRPKK